MPRFYFHLHDELDVPDSEGTEFPDLARAREYARSSARYLICDGLVRDGRICLSHRIDIEDEQGKVVATEGFGDAIEIKD